MRSTRCLIIALAACAWSLPAHAQNLETGVKAGFDITSMPKAGEVLDQVVGQVSRETSSRLGLTFGGWVRFPLTDTVSFEPELLFAMKGVKLDETAGGTGSARINYLEFPLLGRYVLPVDSDLKPYVFGGPSFGVKLSSSLTFDGTKGAVGSNIDSALKTLDLGLAMGGGVQWSRYLVEVRYTAGLTDIMNTNFPHPDSVRNSTVSFMAGLKLP